MFVSKCMNLSERTTFEIMQVKGRRQVALIISAA